LQQKLFFSAIFFLAKEQESKGFEAKIKKKSLIIL
jgi:hypothetical protein